MRKFVQKQILELMSTVLEGLKYATVKSTQHDFSLSVLEDCYAGIEAIDHSLKVNLSAERYLFYEEKNNLLRDMLEDLAVTIKNHVSVSKVSKNIRDYLSLIKKEIANEPEVKLEIVFMPYKSSMWDCLESIWRATEEDPKCQAYVIPIPYYVRNPDHSFGELHYEGEDFPANVPIISYDLYDLTKHQPDVIYIHNPYDQYNYVTSVDPNYYSYELKKHTDMLVYVPYFVTGGGVPEGHMNLPVFNYMDKMIVQSEEHRQIYSTTVPKNKLIALGSPKVDRMIYYENHRPEVPQEWKEVIEDKKIVMYNISISSVLKHGIKAMQKMSYVFSVFQNRRDVVLLWRPHPLMESTLKSMNPALMEVYLNLKEQYIREKIGIYDETPDITASITIADAYIGEESSSIVHLFGVVGKPIFLMNTQINQEPTEEDITALSFSDCYIEKDNLWFVSNKYNYLCQMDLNSEKVKLITDIPSNAPIGTNGQYSDVLKIEDKIFMLPVKASKICEYDLLKRRFKVTTIADPVPFNFIRMVHYKDSLFLIPRDYLAILQYDIKRGKIKYHKKCMQEFRNISENSSSMFSWDICVRENLLLIASATANKVMEFNMDTGKSEAYTVGAEGVNYFGMAFDGTDYWLISNEGRAIVKWNYETKEFIEYNKYPENFIGQTRCFVGIVYCGVYMLVFPRESNMIIKIDVATGNMEEFKICIQFKEDQCRTCYNISDRKYYFAKKHDEKHVIAMDSFDNTLLLINTKTEEYETKKCRVSVEDIENQISIKKHFGKLHKDMPYASIESAYLALERFINYYVISKERYEEDTQRRVYATIVDNMDGTCGEKIHKKIKEHLF